MIEAKPHQAPVEASSQIDLNQNEASISPPMVMNKDDFYHKMN